MPLPFDSPLWLLETEQPCYSVGPPYIGNGRLGLRLGTYILGMDSTAPPLTTAKQEETFRLAPRFDHSSPLQFFAAHARDVYQLAMPSWANVDITVNGQRLDPSHPTVSSNTPMRTWLDLRSGEAGMDGIWRNGNNDPIEVKVRLVTLRSMPHGAHFEIELKGLKSPATLELGFLGTHALEMVDQRYAIEGDDILGDWTTRNRNRPFKVAMRVRCEASGGATSTPLLDAPGQGRLRVEAAGPDVRLQAFISIRGGTESLESVSIDDDLDTLERGIADGSLLREHRRLWRDIWNDGLDVTQLPLERRDQQLLLAQQFYLLASYDHSSHPIGVIGLSGNQWCGQSMWDVDLWQFRAVNALWPQLARRVVRSRINMLPNARLHARSLGLAGAWFGWMCDEEGIEQAPAHYQTEIHVNAWILLAAWESTLCSPDDRAWLSECYPLIRDLADAACSRATKSPDGRWHLLGVLPPDESVVENPANPGTCDDSILTNIAFARALRAAVEVAAKLGETPPLLWREVADNLVLLPPDDRGVIPEYLGYNGHFCKQGDTILAFYPCEYDPPRDVIQATTDYYRGRVMWGPLMTEQVDTTIRLRHGFGDREKLLHDLIQRYRRFVHGVFEVPYECVDNSNSIMLTGCGGLIATMVYGWFDVRSMDQLSKVPRIG